MGRTPVRVVVADDSALARQLLCELLGSDPDIEVVGVATNGAEAVTLVERLRPNIVTMDLRMPGTDGLAATAEIMRRVPTPVLLVTSSDFRLRQNDVFDSFRYGVVDVLEKPPLNPDGAHSASAKTLLEKIKVLSRIKVTASKARMPAAPTGARPADRPSAQPTGRAIGLGASTGGPRVLPAVLAELPADLAAPVFIAQHMSGPFVPAFAEWLAADCPLPVAVAHDGETPTPGRVLVAPGGLNMVLDASGVVRLNTDSAPAGIRPSVDLLLQSLAQVYGPRAIGVVLTGIGRDGTEGLRAIKRAGGLTMVQDAASCVVNGMPGAALAEGVADAEVELTSMGKTLGELVAGRATLGRRGADGGAGPAPAVGSGPGGSAGARHRPGGER
jgi:two-component system chemotaxis response regulator CheB